MFTLYLLTLSTPLEITMILAETYILLECVDFSWLWKRLINILTLVYSDKIISKIHKRLFTDLKYYFICAEIRIN